MRRWSGKICMRHLILIIALASTQALAQNYTSIANGGWTSASTWSGGTAPSTSSQNWGTTAVNHDITLSGNYAFQGSTLNIAAGKSLAITGNFSLSNGATVNVYGTITIGGNATLDATLRIHPGGTVIIDGSATVVNSTYLLVGTSAAPPAYANLVIRQNLRSQSSGDVTVAQNGRMAVFGNITNDTSGGTLLVIQQGGQAYVHGNINLQGGGDNIVNQNASTPFGLYVNGSISNSGGGSTTTANVGNQATMSSTNPAFAQWVMDNSNMLLPISLLSFRVERIDAFGITLGWVTASETNCDYFIIESSHNGEVFEERGRVRGNGTTTARHTYRFVDYATITGRLYYRLKSVDFDGSAEVFNVVAVNISQAVDVSVYPNPVTDGKFTIRLNEEVAGGQAIVMDMSGTVLLSMALTGHETEVAFNAPYGTYLVKVTLASGSMVLRIVVTS